MARDWEATFRSWTGPSSDTEEAKRDRTEEEIRKALQSHAALEDHAYKVYAKGSYKNNTNVRRDSDVDICVELTEFYLYDRLPGAENATLQQLGVEPYTRGYTVDQFKDDVEAALVTAFGRSKVKRDGPAVKVREASTTLPADVVPCVELREFYTDNLGQTGYRQGTRLFPEAGLPFDNYPQQHYAQGVAKNTRTSRRFKQVVRILKRLENELVDDGRLTTLPSYLVECLVYNVDDKYFGNDQYTADVRGVLATVFNATRDDASCKAWFEVNDIKYLFHSSQKWNREQAHQLVSMAWDYVGFE